MDKKPRISVVIAAYNEEKYLPNCLKAIRAQNFPKENYEIIVVDNNSKDKTAEIARSFGAKVIVEKKQGNTFAVSKGLKNAKGEIVAATDADTNVYPDWFSVILNAFSDEKVVAVTGTAYTDSGRKFFDFLSRKSFEYFMKFNFLMGKRALSGFNYAVRKEALEKVGGIDERFIMSSDVDLGLRISRLGKVLFLNRMKVTTSLRRWKKASFSAIYVYISGYIWTVWLRRPPAVRQKAVR
jgi:cellulose synthase/poly-beta-1,6-N-acetylglucosamine synthase-like glycosyltransferase